MSVNTTFDCDAVATGSISVVVCACAPAERDNRQMLVTVTMWLKANFISCPPKSSIVDECGCFDVALEAPASVLGVNTRTAARTTRVFIRVGAFASV
jgi:hypothetical protein